MRPFRSIILCATPRSGSTLLCDLMQQTGVLGQPHSFYREEDIEEWADYLGVARPDGDTGRFERDYLAAVIRYGTSPNGVFALRLMQASLSGLAQRLAALWPDTSGTPALFEAAFGPPLYIHLSRYDKIAQAISRLKAEQTGLWHKNADGSERERTAPGEAPHFDPDRIAALVAELHADEAAWNRFFADHAITPLRLTYETLTPQPKLALAAILTLLDQEPTIAESVTIGTAKLADNVNADWAVRFRGE